MDNSEKGKSQEGERPLTENSEKGKHYRKGERTLLENSEKGKH